MTSAATVAVVFFRSFFLRLLHVHCCTQSVGVAKYDDAISAGTRAALLEQSSTTTSIALGNIEPAQVVSVTLQLMQTLALSGDEVDKSRFP